MTEKEWNCEQCRQALNKKTNWAIGLIPVFLVAVLGLSSVAWTARTKAENVEVVVKDIHKQQQDFQKDAGKKIEKILTILELWEKGKLKNSTER